MDYQDILARLKTDRFGKEIVNFQTIDSTSSHAKILASEGAEEGTVVIAEEQLHGRGRQGRSWHATPGKNLTFSLILRPKIDISQIGMIPLFAGVAVLLGIQSATGNTLSLKWPNDILHDGRKICGILVESVVFRHELSAVVVGIGLNVNERDFPPSLRNTSASLVMDGRPDLDRASILAKILLHLEQMYPLLQPARKAELISLWTQHCRHIGKEITVHDAGEMIHGVALGIADDGGLMLETEDGIKKIISGEVPLA